MNILSEYISYIFKAKGRHGTHSPFVYKFVSECLKTNMSNNFVLERKKLFKSLKKDSRKLNIQDFGAGSKKLGNIRTVKSIFKTNSSKGKYGDLLYKIANYYPSSEILEMGTSIGIGSIHFSKGNEYANITTIEACKEIQDIAIQNFNSLNCFNIHSVCSTFNAYFENNNNKIFDVVFVDGHHDGKALLEYLNKLDSLTHNDTLFILDDIRWSDSMFDSWNKIVESEKYHLTMDLFRMGIISKRNQQMKEHFTIRI